MIPVIINNRDLLTWPKAMVEKLKQLEGIGDIIIVDNGSSYSPLLEWYKTKPCTIKYYPNYGHAGAWISGVVNKLKSKFYVVTDPDLGINNIPNDTLLYLKDKMNTLLLDKVGLGLNWEIVEEKSPYYKRLNLYEKDRWNNSIIKNDVYLNVQIDTTFALYSSPNYFIGGASTTHPYVARHYPWEFSVKEAKNNEEFSYYLKNASQSCSYKKVVTSFT